MILYVQYTYWRLLKLFNIVIIRCLTLKQDFICKLQDKKNYKIIAVYLLSLFYTEQEKIFRDKNIKLALQHSLICARTYRKFKYPILYEKIWFQFLESCTSNLFSFLQKLLYQISFIIWDNIVAISWILQLQLVFIRARTFTQNILCYTRQFCNNFLHLASKLLFRVKLALLLIVHRL